MYDETTRRADRDLEVQPGELGVDLACRIFLDAKRFGPMTEECMWSDLSGRLDRAIRVGDKTLIRVTIKSHYFIPYKGKEDP